MSFPRTSEGCLAPELHLAETWSVAGAPAMPLVTVCVFKLGLFIFLVGLEFELRALCFKAGPLPFKPHF
jgi:hypothetical protein